MRAARRAIFLAGLALVFGIGASPAAPTYLDVRRVIAEIRHELPSRPAKDRPVWETFCNGLEAELKRFAAATTDAQRRASLDRLAKYHTSIKGVSWERAVQARDRLDAWLAPRRAVADASARLVARVGRPATTKGAEALVRRDRWQALVETRLGSALRDYESADTTLRRLRALGEIHAVLDTLQTSNRTRPWDEGRALQLALEDLCDGPNLDAAADAASLAVFLQKDVVESGPLTYRGQTSDIIAGPHLGFALLTCDQGIAFSNAQKATTITPIRGFQDQLAADAQGRKAASLYQFGATSRDDSQVTIVTLLTTDGIRLRPSTTHSLHASIRSAPIAEPGLGITREFASLIGYDQQEINGQVRQGLMAQLRREVPARAAEISRKKAAEAAAELNAKLRANLPGDGTICAPAIPVHPSVSIGPIEVAGADLQSRPDRAFLVGTLQWREAATQHGADQPPPDMFRVAEPGAVLHLHLASMLGNMARGLFQTPGFREARDLMVVARKPPTADGPKEPLETVVNPADAAFHDAARLVEEPGRFVIRIRRPDKSPEFAVDAEGRLVAVVHDFRIDVPAPAPKGLASLFGGGSAPAGPRVYRITSPAFEVALKIEFGPTDAGGPPRLVCRVDGVDLGPEATVEEVGPGADEARPANALVKAGALAAFDAKLQGQSFDVPLEKFDAPAGFVLRSISPLDPSGWIRVVLVRD